MSKNNQPYIVPLSFGYDSIAIYFHSAQEGKKIEYLTANANVCFEFDLNVKIISNPSAPCKWSCSFQSIIGFGTVVELLSNDEKSKGLTCIMNQYSDKKWDFPKPALDKTRVWKLVIKSMTGKQSADFKTDKSC